MRVIYILLVVSLFLSSGCAPARTLAKEQVSSSAELIKKEVEGHILYDLNYTMNGKNYILPFNPVYRDSLDWIRSNLKPQDKILCWYDYDRMIQGYTDRVTVGDTKAKQDIAIALATDNHQDTIYIMGLFNATYLFIAQPDKTNIQIAKDAGRKLNDNSILIRAVRHGEIPGFTVAYMDTNVSIYHLLKNE